MKQGTQIDCFRHRSQWATWQSPCGGRRNFAPKGEKKKHRRLNMPPVRPAGPFPGLVSAYLTQVKAGNRVPAASGLSPLCGGGAGVGGWGSIFFWMGEAESIRFYFVFLSHQPSQYPTSTKFIVALAGGKTIRRTRSASQRRPAGRIRSANSRRW